MSPARTLHRAAVGAVALTVAIGLAACGSSGGSSTAGSSGSSTSSSSNSALQTQVTKLEQPVSSYTYPSASLTGVSGLAGKTVYYIPITQQAPQFSIAGSALTTALGKAGVHVQVCNGNSNPSDINKCVGQATGAKAGAIVLDAIPYFLAANSLSAARKAGIPVIIADQIEDPKFPASSDLAYVGATIGSNMLKATADWIIVDSGGKANVLFNVATDNPSSIAYAGAAQAEFASQCSGCKVTVNKISSANFPLVAPSTSSALLKTPGVNYVISQYDQFLQPTYGGVQQAGKTAAVKGGSSAVGLSGMQMLKAKQFLAVDSGVPTTFEAWTFADAALRLMLKQAVPAYDYPTRIFNQDNVTSLTLTPAAQASGEWYGPTDFDTNFLKLWGLS